ncbi:amino acid ABC transporter permease [Candidatus Bipolaricaulota sp. J31]
MDIILREFPWFLRGILVTLEVLSGVMAVGFLLGLFLSVLEVYGPRPISLPATVIERALRGVPPIVLLLLVFYLPWDLPPLAVAIAALGTCSGAYQSQIFRSAIRSVGRGQMEAGLSLGMTRLQTMVHVVLPQALRRAIGPWSNEFASQLKDTSLAYIVGVVEILRQARYVIAYTFGHSFLIYGFCALIYFALTRAGNHFIYRLEERLRIPGFEGRRTAEERRW